MLETFRKCGAEFADYLYTWHNLIGGSKRPIPPRIGEGYKVQTGGVNGDKNRIKCFITRSLLLD